MMLNHLGEHTAAARIQTAWRGVLQWRLEESLARTVLQPLVRSWAEQRCREVEALAAAEIQAELDRRFQPVSDVLDRTLTQEPPLVSEQPIRGYLGM